MGCHSQRRERKSGETEKGEGVSFYLLLLTNPYPDVAAEEEEEVEWGERGGPSLVATRNGLFLLLPLACLV